MNIPAVLNFISFHTIQKIHNILNHRLIGKKLVFKSPIILVSNSILYNPYPTLCKKKKKKRTGGGNLGSMEMGVMMVAMPTIIQPKTLEERVTTYKQASPNSSQRWTTHSHTIHFDYPALFSAISSLNPTFIVSPHVYPLCFPLGTGQCNLWTSNCTILCHLHWLITWFPPLKPTQKYACKRRKERVSTTYLVALKFITIYTEKWIREYSLMGFFLELRNQKILISQ